MTFPLALFDFNWTSTPWIMWALVGIIAFVVVRLMLNYRASQNASPALAGAGGSTPSGLSAIAFGPAPAPVAGGRLAPKANPHDVAQALDELATLATLEGQTELAIILSNLANGDEAETHRAIRELATRYRSPRAITAAAKGVVLRHLEELLDDVDVKRILDRRKV